MQSDERRLHPAAIVLGAVEHLKGLAVPLVFAALGAGRSGGWWWLVIAGLLVANVGYAVAQYLTFRYRFAEGELVVKSGVLSRTERHIPYARIHNLDSVGNPLHRLFGVTEVRVQTGSGSEPEAVLIALHPGAAFEMQQRVHAETGGATEPMAHVPVVALSTRELVLVGLVELRGIAVIAAALGLAWEVVSNVVEERRLARDLLAWLFGIDERDPLRIAGAIGAVLAIVVLLSIAWAIVRMHGFRAVRDGDVMHTAYGLLTHVTGVIHLPRIQTLTIDDGPLHRVLGRVAVAVATAGGVGDESGSERARLAPILPAARLQALVDEVMPGLVLDRIAWQPLASRAARRVFVRDLLVAIPLAAVSAYWLAWWALAVLAALAVVGAIHARAYARHARWAIDDTIVAFRRGWLWRRTTVARLAKVQVVALGESPFDRRHAMARVGIDTAGETVAIPYLPRATAIELHAAVASAAARTAFAW
jgi:putative membrane protein